MRLALVSLFAIAGFATAAQAQMPAPAPDPAAAQPPPVQPMPVQPPAAPAAPAPMDAAPVAPAPPPVVAEAPPPPPAPPPAPTDPTAIAVMNVLENVCMPAANGGNLEKIAKSAGYRRSGDNFVLKQPGFQLTVLSQGFNPTQCHVDLVHPIDPEAPAKPLVIALHNWAVLTHGWTLYRNDKNVSAGQEFTTRSWEHTADGKNEAVVITTMRKADGTPAQKNADTSTLIYSVTKTPG
jgi:hypothetical protein